MTEPKPIGTVLNSCHKTPRIIAVTKVSVEAFEFSGRRALTRDEPAYFRGFVVAPCDDALMTITMRFRWTFHVSFYTIEHSTLDHWIEHVKISRTVLFQLWKYCF